MASDAWPEAFEMPAIWRLKSATNHWGGRGSAPDTDRAWGTYSASPDPLAGGEGLAAPSATTHPLSRPFSAFQAWGFGPLGATRIFKAPQSKILHTGLQHRTFE